jgi:tRNA U34 5-methylaminomethyl-2-thiouridine-forming methyltransferase MnmC
MKREVVFTKDGSKTIFVPELDEHYHSIHGARQESMHVFIKNGFDAFKNKGKVSILEVGFGTGLNAFLTLATNNQNAQDVEYVGLEPFPVEKGVVNELIQDQFDADEQSNFLALHEADWNVSVAIGPYFTIKKIQRRIEDFSSHEHFELIYFDAFGPRAQAELWMLPIFQKTFELLAQGGRMVTYCAKGQVKRDLKLAGFRVESVPGPPGKREMTIAHKD